MHVHIIKMGGTIEFIDPAYDEFNKLNGATHFNNETCIFTIC